MASFADFQYCIYADIVRGWVNKCPKTYKLNLRMVPYLEHWFSNRFGTKLVESPSMAKRIHWDHDSTETNNTHLIMK